MDGHGTGGEDRWKTVFDNLHLGLATCGIESLAAETCNPSFARMYGYEPGEVVGMAVACIFGEGSEAYFREACVKAVADGVHVYTDDHRRRSGETFPVSVGVTLVRRDDGSPHYLIVNTRDVTDRRRLEDQFHEAQKLEAIGRLAGGIAHDFNNLLTVITVSSMFVRNALPPGSESAEDMTEVLRAADRARDLTAQLLTFSRKQVVEPEVLDINEHLVGMTGMLRRLLGEDIDLVWTTAGDAGTVKIDPSKLEQVLVNLAVNARDAMPRGGRLVLETGLASLDEQYSLRRPVVRSGEYVMIAMSDNGCGMSDAVLSHVFEPFFTTKDVGKGSGLGLSTCYGIVKQAGGYIWAYSEPGHGTTMKVYLPRVHEKAEPPRRPSKVPENLKGNETVLVAEDEPSVRSLIVRTLAGAGYWVLEAKDGEDAVAAALEHQGHIHLLLTDVVMPRMGGPEAFASISAERPLTKVLYVSGYTDEAIASHGFLMKGAALVQKPFAPHALLNRVRMVLDGESG